MKALRAPPAAAGALALAAVAAMSVHPLQAAEHVVEIRKLEFFPASLRVRVGDTITWINRDIVPHTATAIGKSWDTRKLKKGESRSLRVTAGMQTSYYCRFHPVMKAKFNIRVDD